MVTPRVLYCHCAFAQVVPRDVKTRVLEDLTSSSCSFDAVPDLCEMSARRDPALAQIASGGATIVACYPRAVKWLFSAAAVPLPDGVRILNMREQTAEDITSALRQDSGHALRQDSGQALRQSSGQAPAGQEAV